MRTTKLLFMIPESTRNLIAFYHSGVIVISSKKDEGVLLIKIK